MNTLIKVARYQLSNRFGFVFLPWAIMALDFVIAVAIVGSLPPSNGHPRYAGALSAIYIAFVMKPDTAGHVLAWLGRTFHSR